MHGPFFTNSVVSIAPAHAGHVADVVRVDDAGVAEAVFEMLGLRDRLVDVAARERTERTASSARPGRTGWFVGLAEQQLGRGRHLLADPRGQKAASCPRKSLLGTSCLCSPSPTVVIAMRVRASTSRAESRTAPARSIAASIWSKTLPTTKTSFSAMHSRLLSYKRLE